MSEGRFETVAPGRFRVSGALDFETVPAIWEASRDDLGSTPESEIDLAPVTDVDSAGLALVVEWIGRARERGQRLVLANVPDKLSALARIGDLEALLRSGA